MREVITFARHGHAPSGTLHQVQAGWAYGYPHVASPASVRFFGEADVEPKAPIVLKTPAQPPVVSVTLPEKRWRTPNPIRRPVRAGADRARPRVAARVHAAIAAGKVPAAAVAARAQKSAEHAEHLELAVYGAYNAIALLQAKIGAQREAGKSQAAPQRALNKLRARTDALARSAARSAATAEALGASVGGEVTPGLFYGFGQDDAPATDSYALEEEAAVAVADASNAIAADDLPAADHALDKAAAFLQQASAVRAIEVATGDLSAQVEAALSPGRIPWKAIGVAAALIALAKTLAR